MASGGGGEGCTCKVVRRESEWNGVRCGIVVTGSHIYGTMSERRSLEVVHTRDKGVP